MKQLLILTLLITLTTSFINSQNNSKVDNLIIELEKSKGIDRIKILIRLSDTYKISDPFKAYSYAREALKLSSSNKYSQGLILAHENIGVFFQFTARYSKALENYFIVNELIEKLGGNDDLLMKNNNLLGEVYKDIKEYDKALEYYNKALELATKTGNLNMQIVINVNIAFTNIEQKDFTNALKISKKTLKISKDKDYLFGIMISLFNIGLINNHIGEYNKAIDYFHRIENMVEEYSEQIGTEFVLGKIKLNQAIAESYYSINNFEAAQKYGLKCWDIAEKSNFKLDFKKNNDFLYKYYLNRGNHTQALKHFEISYKLNDELKSEINNRQLLLLETIENERKKANLANLAKQEKDRRFRLEYFGISIVILMIFFGTFFLGRFSISSQIVHGIIFLSLLLLFEFALILIDPLVELHTSGEPIYKMLVNSCLAIIFTFLHRFFERKIAFKTI